MLQFAPASRLFSLFLKSSLGENHEVYDFFHDLIGAVFGRGEILPSRTPFKSGNYLIADETLEFHAWRSRNMITVPE